MITPVVDDPFIYGQIAAANSLSDVFAMGAEVVTALNIVGFDSCHQSYEVLKEILNGGESKVKECGGSIVGGHTIETPEMLYGLSVSGFIHPDKIYKNNSLREGDVLILTKPLGIGILTTALKADMLDSITMNKVIKVLSQLNYKASLAMRDFDVSACTDITGFGLIGHSYEMCTEKFTIEFNLKSIPIIGESIEKAEMGIIPGGSYKNRVYFNKHVDFKTHYNNEIILYDAQTSGGLLIAVSQKDSNALLSRLKNEGYEHSAIVGVVKKFEDKSLIFI